MGELAGQRFIRRGLAEARNHRRDLRVEQRIGDQPALMIENLDVLPRRVQHLHDLGRLHQLEERRQIDVLGQGIDDGFDAGRGHLQKAQLRPVGLVAHEFGVEGDVLRPLELGHEGLQFLGVGHG